MHNTSATIDWEQLDMIADGFTPDFVEIYREYLSETPSLFQQLRNFISTNDAPNTSKMAHQIKGSSANFGFVGVSQPMSHLEQAAKSGIMQDAAYALSMAENAFDQAKQEVRTLRGV